MPLPLPFPFPQSPNQRVDRGALYPEPLIDTPRGEHM